mmetsp:Transcript_21196/g.31471  ORF Transcript_21196/g.31471 Transcript_21196/m.31471 type:complete len:98 (+) Transcript_21196:588-881(+)
MVLQIIMQFPLDLLGAKSSISSSNQKKSWHSKISHSTRGHTVIAASATIALDVVAIHPYVLQRAHAKIGWHGSSQLSVGQVQPIEAAKVGQFRWDTA